MQGAPAGRALAIAAPRDSGSASGGVLTAYLEILVHGGGLT